MSISTYAELKTAVADYLARSDLTSYVPDFIRGAEARIAYGGADPFPSEPLRIRQMEDSTSIAASSSISLPGDLLGIRDVYINNSRQDPIEPDTPYGARRRYSGSDSGTPKFYFLEGESMYLYPPPDTTDQIRILFYKKLTPVESGTPWLLTNAPHVYVYGALVEAAPFLRKDARIAMWHGMFKAAVAGLNGTSRAARWPSGAAVRVDA